MFVPAKTPTVVRRKEGALRFWKNTRTEPTGFYLEKPEIRLPWNSDSRWRCVGNPSRTQTPGSKQILVKVLKGNAVENNLSGVMHGLQSSPSALPRSSVSGWTTVAMTAVYWRLKSLQELQHHRKRGRERGERGRLGVAGKGLDYLRPSPSPGAVFSCFYAFYAAVLRAQ